MFAATSAARGVTLPVRPLAIKVRAIPRRHALGLLARRANVLRARGG